MAALGLATLAPLPQARAEAPPPPLPVVTQGLALGALRLDILRQPIALADSAALEAWRTRVWEGPAEGVSCARVAERPRVLLCLFARSTAISALFARATWFAEQPGAHLAPAAAVADPFRVTPPLALRGADLRARDLIAFAEAAMAACHAGAELVCPTAAEKAFLTQVALPFARADARAVFLAAGAGPGAWGTLSHEWLHGLFFTTPALRIAVYRYWREALSPIERQGVTTILGRLYDSDRLPLLVNEFQAHLLQCAPTALLTDLVGEHRAPLRALLERAGVSPLPDCAGQP